MTIDIRMHEIIPNITAGDILKVTCPHGCTAIKILIHDKRIKKDCAPDDYRYTCNN